MFVNGCMRGGGRTCRAFVSPWNSDLHTSGVSLGCHASRPKRVWGDELRVEGCPRVWGLVYAGYG